MKNIVAVFCAAVALAGWASATDVYVATNGVDAVGRGTQEAPYATVKYAVTNNTAPLTVYVGAGKYVIANNNPITLNHLTVAGSRAVHGSRERIFRSPRTPWNATAP